MPADDETSRDETARDETAPDDAASGEVAAGGLPADDPRRPVRPSGAPVRGRRAARVENGESTAPMRPQRPVRPEGLGERAAVKAGARAAELPEAARAAEAPATPAPVAPAPIPERPVPQPERLPMPRRVLEPDAVVVPLAAAPVLPSAITASLAPALVTAAVVLPALPEPPRRELTALTHHVIGGGTALLTRQPPSGGGKKPLATLPATLPEPSADDLPKPLRRQPAFIVAMIAAIVIVLGVVGFLVLQQVLKGPDTVADLSVLDGGNNYVLQWNGPDVPYSVAVTNAPSSTIDVTRFIKGGREAFVPKAGLGVSKDSCFIVRSQAEASAHPDVPTSASAVSAEGAQRFCVSDIDH